MSAKLLKKLNSENERLQAECDALAAEVGTLSQQLAATAQQLAAEDWIEVVPGEWLRKSEVRRITRDPTTGGSRINAEISTKLRPEELLALLQSDGAD